MAGDGSKESLKASKNSQEKDARKSSEKDTSGAAAKHSKRKEHKSAKKQKEQTTRDETVVVSHSVKHEKEETTSKRRRAKEGLVTLAHKAAAIADPNLLDTNPEGASDVPDDLKADSKATEEPPEAPDDDDDDDTVNTETDVELIDELMISDDGTHPMTLQEIMKAVEDRVVGLKNSKDDEIDDDDEVLLHHQAAETPRDHLKQVLDQMTPAAREKVEKDSAAMHVLRLFVDLQPKSQYAAVAAMQAYMDDRHTEAAEGQVVRLSQYERDMTIFRERNRFSPATGFQPLIVDDIGMEMKFSEPTDVYHMPMSKLRKQLAEGYQVLHFLKSKEKARMRRNAVIWVAASVPQLCIAPLIKTGKDDNLMPSNTVKTIPISNILEIRLGQKTQPFERRAQRHKYEHESYDRSFSLVLMSGKTLDFVTGSNLDFQLWVHGLIRLILSVQAEGPAFVPLQRAWRTAKKTTAVTYGELVPVFHALNIHRGQAKELLKAYGFDKGTMYPFSVFTEKLADGLFKRTGISKIFQKFSAGSKMTLDEFRNFLLRQQLEDHGEGYVASMMKKISGEELLSPADFERYLESHHNSAWDPVCTQRVHHDMSQPLVHYYINSSHNTYCAQDQLLGISSNDMYRRVLLQGCRCVELDTWDGTNGEPVIYHGHTMTTKILVEDVCRVVMSYAFVVSPYPVVLSIENHCGVEQQARMAEILEDVLGPMMATFPPDGETPFVCPSPEDLRYKILVKGKFSCEAMAKLVWMHSTPIAKAKELVETSALAHPCVSSLTEGAIGKAAVEKMRKISKSAFIRTYPAGDRFNSTNYNPDHAWNCGCHMVALNMQTSDIHMWRNAAKFADNGGCGLLLKPLQMWTRSALDEGNAPFTLEVTVLSARNLPKRSSHGDHVSSPQVKLVLTGEKKGKIVKKTKSIKSSGLNPEWNKTFSIPLRNPDNALLTFIVMDTHAASGAAGLKPTKKGGATAAGATVATGSVLAAGAVVATGGLALPLVLGGAAAGALGAAVGYSYANKSRSAKLAYAAIPLNCLRSGYRILPLVDKNTCVDTLCDLLIHTKIKRG